MESGPELGCVAFVGQGDVAVLAAHYMVSELMDSGVDQVAVPCHVLIVYQNFLGCRLIKAINLFAFLAREYKCKWGYIGQSAELVGQLILIHESFLEKCVLKV